MGANGSRRAELVGSTSAVALTAALIPGVTLATNKEPTVSCKRYVLNRHTLICLGCIVCTLTGLYVSWGSAMVQLITVSRVLARLNPLQPSILNIAVVIDSPAPSRPTLSGDATILTPEAKDCPFKNDHQFLYQFHSSQKSNRNETCSLESPGSVGPIRVITCVPHLSEVEQLNFHLENGGHYRPKHCVPQFTIAIIIPFRNHWQHLAVLLFNLHPFLQKQQLEYSIYIIDQEEGSKFNRGLLINAGFMETSKLGHYDCYIFHDIDLIPEDDRNYYNCLGMVHHLAAAVETFNYSMPYVDYIGGVLAITKAAFQNVNGYSNLFFGWGGEDDEFAARLYDGGYDIARYDASIARYKTIKHDRDSGNEDNPARYKLLEAAGERTLTDGLNSLIYTVRSISLEKLYTRILVSVDPQEVLNKFDGLAAKVNGAEGARR